jgi:hypothetical protein
MIAHHGRFSIQFTGGSVFCKAKKPSAEVTAEGFYLSGSCFKNTCYFKSIILRRELGIVLLTVITAPVGGII